MSSEILSAKDAGEIFEEVAELLEFQGENQFRVRAYETAARLLVSQTMSIPELMEEVKGGRIKGIGTGLQEALREISESGSYSLLSELRLSFPDGLRQLMRVSGLGPKKLKVLHEQLGISNLDAFLEACADGRLLEVKGFSEKTVAKLADAARRVADSQGHLLLSQATEETTRFAEALQEKAGLRVVCCGETRRAMPIVTVLEVVVEEREGEPDKGIIGSVGSDVRVTTAPPEIFGARLIAATGAPAHVDLLRDRAASLGMSLDPDGLRKGAQLLHSSSEEDIYHALELVWIPPEMREGRNEVEIAAEAFQSKSSTLSLLEVQDLRGILHAHTTYSDGKNTLREMAEEARRRGFQYLGITDHSQSAAYAGGLKVPAILKQRREIERLNEELAPFRIFHGIESDILVDGSLDYDDATLASFDFVIASIHSRFSLERQAMTDRLIRAIENPHTTILGHPSGRKLLERPGYDFDPEAVLRAASECGVAIEMNANPRRLDLDWEYLQAAVELGIKIPICPDAHSIAGFDDVRWGVSAARKGGIRAENVPNCLALQSFAAWLEAR